MNRRVPWMEWEGRTSPGLQIAPEVVVLYMLGHPDGVEPLRASLVPELAQSGIADSVGVAWAMSERAIFIYGWYGYIEDGPEASWCDGHGLTADEDMVERAIPCVYAVITR